MPTGKILTGLSPLIPPITDWPFSQYASENNIWYYLQGDATKPSEEFKHSFTDPDLKILSVLLRRSGCQITPTCGGVFSVRAEDKELWNLVKTEEKYIRRIGIKLINTLSHEEFMFLDSGYRVPWGNLESFQVYRQSLGRGYVGIMIPADKTTLIEDFSKAYRTNSSSIARRDNMTREGQEYAYFVAEVRGGSKEEQTAEWKKLTSFAIPILLKQDICQAS